MQFIAFPQPFYTDVSGPYQLAVTYAKFCLVAT